MPVAADSLMVVDANLASLKTDIVVDRSIVYTLSPASDGYVAKVTIKYKNRGGFSWKTTRYRNYVRVFVPAGSELVASSGAMLNDKILDPQRLPSQIDVIDELGRRSFGAFVSVEPGETRQLEISYRLPALVATRIKLGSYSLYVQKQPGLVAVPLTIDLDFGKKVTVASPPELPARFGDNKYSFSTDLRLDRQFEVGF